VWHRPNAESIPAAENVTETPAVNKPAPMTTALGQSSSRNAEAARCAATSDEEHAVSVVKHGPVNPSAYERRPESTDSAPAVAECAETPSGETALAAAGEPEFELATLPPAPRKTPTGMFASCTRRLDPESSHSTP